MLGGKLLYVVERVAHSIGVATGVGGIISTAIGDDAIAKHVVTSLICAIVIATERSHLIGVVRSPSVYIIVVPIVGHRTAIGQSWQYVCIEIDESTHATRHALLACIVEFIEHII